MANIKISTVTLKTIELTPSFIAQCVRAQTNAHTLVDYVNSMLQTPHEDEWKIQILLNEANNLSDFVDSLMEAITNE